MFVLVIGGGKVGYYLTKELIDAGHEVVLMEKDRRRADQIADEIGSIVIAHDGCEGKYLKEAGANRADIVAAVTGDDEDNLVICQMAKHHFDVPRTIARVNNPKNEELFRHLGVDEIISPTRMILGSIEQDIPVHELLHLAALEGELEIIEAQLQDGSPAIGRGAGELDMPEGCSLLDGGPRRQGDEARTRRWCSARATRSSRSARPDCEGPLRAQLIGDYENGVRLSAAGRRQRSSGDGAPARRRPALGLNPGRHDPGSRARRPRQADPGRPCALRRSLDARARTRATLARGEPRGRSAPLRRGYALADSIRPCPSATSRPPSRDRQHAWPLDWSPRDQAPGGRPGGRRRVAGPSPGRRGNPGSRAQPIARKAEFARAAVRVAGGSDAG